MKKDVVLSMRVTRQAKDKLDAICEKTLRSQSDMVTLLVQEAWTKTFVNQSSTPVTEPVGEVSRQ